MGIINTEVAVCSLAELRFNCQLYDAYPRAYVAKFFEFGYHKILKSLLMNLTQPSVAC